MNLPEFSIRKPVTIIVAMLIFITIGVISILKLPLEMLPDTSFPGLMVQVSYPSSSPEEVERVITRPLEDRLATINNLESFSSTSSSSSSNIHMQFKGGTNMDLATMEIRDKIDQMRDQLAAVLINNRREQGCEINEEEQREDGQRSREGRPRRQRSDFGLLGLPSMPGHSVRRVRGVRVGPL